MGLGSQGADKKSSASIACFLAANGVFVCLLMLAVKKDFEEIYFLPLLLAGLIGLGCTEAPPPVATGCPPMRHPASPLGAHQSATVRRHWVPTEAPPRVATGCLPKRHPASPLGAHRNATPRRHWVPTKAPPRVAPFGAGVPLHVPVYQEQKDLHKTRLFYS